MCGWRLWELLPDDEWEFEFNILTFYKQKHEKNCRANKSWVGGS
jgi:hypothetical protein